LKSLSYLNKYFFKYRYRLLLGIIFITVSNLFAIYPAQVTRITIDFVTSSYGVYQLFNGTSVQQHLFDSYAGIFLFFFGVILLSTLLKGLFMFFMRQTVIIMSRFIEYDLKNEIFAKYQELDLAFYRRNNTGDLMARISEDVSQVRMYLGPAIMYSINLLVLFFLVVGGGGGG
jgi:ATP-binding cassette, subfamily B, multidrug efflux pump